MTSGNLIETVLDQLDHLEMLMSLLVAKYGDRTGDGFQITLDVEEALALRAAMPMEGPMVLQAFDCAACRYVIDVV